MLAFANSYANSYTSGALNAQFPSTRVVTAGPETGIATSSPILINTMSQGWMQRVSGQFRDITKLGPNWDSYGADPPSPLAIAIAFELLLLVDQKLSRLAYEESEPQVVAPRPDGGIQMEWGTQRVEIAVHADPSGNLGYLYIDQQSDILKYEEVPNASWHEVLRLIAKVVFTVQR